VLNIFLGFLARLSQMGMQVDKPGATTKPVASNLPRAFTAIFFAYFLNLAIFQQAHP
jgi:hypothetical protein